MSIHICPICLEEHEHFPPGENQDVLPEMPEIPEPFVPPAKESWDRDVEWVQETEEGVVPAPPEMQTKPPIEVVQTLEEAWPPGLAKKDASGTYWHWDGLDFHPVAIPEPETSEPESEVVA